jgi:kexin
MNRWVFEQINVESVWAQGISGNGIQINIVDDGPDYNHPDFASKFDAAGSCKGTTIGTEKLDHGTTAAAIALAAANDHCSRGIAFNATLSMCPRKGATEDEQLLFAPQRNDISSNSWGIDPCCEPGVDPNCEFPSNPSNGRRLQSSSACPFLGTATLSPCTEASCPTDWSTTLDAACETVIKTYCKYPPWYEADPECASWTHLWMTCSFTHLTVDQIKLLQTGVTMGRGGKGIVYVFASGNENTDGENVNHEQYLHSRYTITVGAVDKLGQHSYYSTMGASLFVCAPGGDTAAHTNNWFVAAPGGGCQGQGDGTSFSTPVVSGVIALILETNPALTYRDVQGIIASSSQKNDPSDTGWITNAAGLNHNIKYGFGRIDAAAAVAAAQTWVLWGMENRIEADSARSSVLVPSDGTPVSFNLSIAQQHSALKTEWVEIYLNIDHSSRGDLQITLVSPSGTSSPLIPGPRPETENPAVTECSAATDTCSVGADNAGKPIYQPPFNWKMTTLRAWGENPTGMWTLIVTDMKTGNVQANSHFKHWSIYIYGHIYTGRELMAQVEF